MRAWFSLIKLLKNKSVIMIQRRWKIYFKEKVLPILIEKKREKASLLLQRLMKGHSVRKQYFKEINSIKINECLKHFGVMQERLQEEQECENTLLRYLLKHWKREAAELKEERLK